MVTVPSGEHHTDCNQHGTLPVRGPGGAHYTVWLETVQNARNSPIRLIAPSRWFATVAQITADDGLSNGSPTWALDGKTIAYLTQV